MKKFEIITNTLELGKVLDILEKVGVSGYTTIKNVMGEGDEALTNKYVLSVCTEEKEHELVEVSRF